MLLAIQIVSDHIIPSSTDVHLGHHYSASAHGDSVWFEHAYEENHRLDGHLRIRFGVPTATAHPRAKLKFRNNRMHRARCPFQYLRLSSQGNY